MEREESNQLLAADCAAIARSIQPSALGAPVDYCDGWPLGDVVRHLGEVHRFVTHVVRTGGPDGAPDGAGDEPTPDHELADWFEAGADRLIAELDRCDPDAECWTFGFRPGKAWFWPRRMLIETMIHRVDVEHALGRTHPLPLTAAIAGLQEVTDIFFDRQVALERTPPLPAPVVLAASDAGEYTLGGPGDPGARITATAADLLLAVWARPHGPIERTGRSDVLAAFDAGALVP